MWRPIMDQSPVQDWPLALCDGRSLEKQNLEEVDLIPRSISQEPTATCYAYYSERYKWYYLDKQRKNEVLLFKTFDSDKSVPANMCLHTSFRHSDLPPEFERRESAEIRALIISKSADMPELESDLHDSQHGSGS